MTELLRIMINKAVGEQRYPSLVPRAAGNGSTAECELRDLMLGSALTPLHDNPLDKCDEDALCGWRDPFPERRGAFGMYFCVDSRQAPDEKAVRQEDQTPMTFDGPQISELVVFESEILFGISNFEYGALWLETSNQKLPLP